MNNNENKYRFRFKQFGVNDSECAMKVGTDGVLIGAWANIVQSQKVLDVGSGSGLISLMIAQRSNATIIGIEIDEPAATQSKYNIDASPWANRITIINSNFIEWATNTNQRFDHIVSNPPFFNSGPTAPNTSRAIARHNNSLDYGNLIKFSKELLSENGRMSIISPIERKEDIIFYSELEELHISRLTQVYSKIGGKATRFLWELSKNKRATEYSSISIRDCNNNFSQEYIDLTNDFYLNF